MRKAMNRQGCFAIISINLKLTLQRQIAHSPGENRVFYKPGDTFASWDSRFLSGHSAGGVGSLVQSNATYTLSMYAKGAATPVVLKLLANGVVVTPTSSVSPTLTSSWREFSRTYDAGDLTSYVGQAITIVCGIDRDAVSTQTRMDDVSLSRCYGGCE